MATLLSPSPAPRPASAGYKVDISRGERIGRVSSEWFSHPDDERFLSLTELHAAVKARAERATTRTVETREVRVEASHDAAEAARAVKRALRTPKDFDPLQVGWIYLRREVVRGGSERHVVDHDADGRILDRAGGDATDDQRLLATAAW